jgi:hypothetical protein
MHTLNEYRENQNMDGKGGATDIWIERLWKTSKYNLIYLGPWATAPERFEGVQTYIWYFLKEIH